jgi:hypothetical protein
MSGISRCGTLKQVDLDELLSAREKLNLRLQAMGNNAAATTNPGRNFLIHM